MYGERIIENYQSFTGSVRDLVPEDRFGPFFFYLDAQENILFRISRLESSTWLWSVIVLVSDR